MSESIEADRVESMSVDDAWAAVQTGLNYVSWMARDFLYTGVSREDLEAEGRLGLFEAALRFDPSHGAQTPRLVFDTPAHFPVANKNKFRVAIIF